MQGCIHKCTKCKCETGGDRIHKLQVWGAVIWLLVNGCPNLHFQLSVAMSTTINCQFSVFFFFLQCQVTIVPIIQLDHQMAEKFELCSLIDSHNCMMLYWPDIIAGICYKSPVPQISCSLWPLCKPNQDIIFNHVTDWHALVETSFLICQTGANARLVLMPLCNLRVEVEIWLPLM